MGMFHECMPAFYNVGAIIMSENQQKYFADCIRTGNAVLGIELGSTRIKAVLTGENHEPIASGGFGWENSQVDGIWTYTLEEVWSGLQGCFEDLQQQVESAYGVRIRKLKAFGISGMMHGYLPFDADGNLLTPFRTWRNTLTGEASRELTGLFNYPIPQRWSVAHLHQAVLNQEDHVGRIAHLTTLAGYVHWKLTGEQVLGVGEASGMFPIDLGNGSFRADFLEAYDKRISDSGVSWKLKDILPRVLSAGEPAGSLTADGVRLLDVTGELEAGVPICPPEGDAGTGMVATNSVEERTGNVSAGTSVFAMLVLEKDLSRAHPEIDLVTTPDGKLVGMVHSNNCTSDINAWVQLLGEAAVVLGAEVSVDDLYGKLLPLALDGDADCGGLLTYGYVSGEHITGFEEGRPLVVRGSDSRFTLANFMRAHLFSALCALRTGLNILVEKEGVRVDEIRGHGGFFKAPKVGQRIMAAATRVPVSVLTTAGEGGAWGIALLAAFAVRGDREQTLPDYLREVFADSMGESVLPGTADADGFDRFFERYHRGLAIERAAVDSRI
jgi:sugar (pentulose or hexulose) kinase